MAIHSSILAWRIPWTEEPGGLQSWGHRAGHDRASNTALHYSNRCEVTLCSFDLYFPKDEQFSIFFHVPISYLYIFLRETSTEILCPFLVVVSGELQGFSRQEYWSGLPFPSPEDLSNPGFKSSLLYCKQILLLFQLQGRSSNYGSYVYLNMGTNGFDILGIVQ